MPNFPNKRKTLAIRYLQDLLGPHLDKPLLGLLRQGCRKIILTRSHNHLPIHRRISTLDLQNKIFKSRRRLVRIEYFSKYWLTGFGINQDDVQTSVMAACALDWDLGAVYRNRGQVTGVVACRSGLDDVDLFAVFFFVFLGSCAARKTSRIQSCFFCLGTFIIRK